MTRSGRSTRPLGCWLGCLTLLVGFPAVVIIGSYVILAHTAVPLKLMAMALKSSEAGLGIEGIEIDGIRGSISRGFRIRSIVIPGREDAEETRLEDLRFQYNGVSDVFRNRRFIISELSVQSAYIELDSSIFDDTDSAIDPLTEESETSEATPSPAPETTPEASSETGSREDEEAEELEITFELRSLELQNVRVRTSDRTFELAIPQFQLAGLLVENGAFVLQSLDARDLSLRRDAIDLALDIPEIALKDAFLSNDRFDIAEFAIASNLIDAELQAIAPEEIDGQMIPYSQRLQLNIAPAIHPRVVQAFDFNIDFAPIGDRVISRFSGFNNAFEQVHFPDRTSRAMVTSFRPRDYFQIESDLVPERCSLVTRREADAPADVAETVGECVLGATQFDFPAPDAEWDAIARTTDLQISARWLDENNQFSRFGAFTSDPPLSQPEIVARIYFQTPLDRLDASQRSRVEAIVRELQQAQPEAGNTSGVSILSDS
ncbi:MAG: hypothetical protein AAFX40_04335 [Cyanobacteria bacterium J06639_1]